MKPMDVPLDSWPPGWLKLECCSILNEPLYIIMTDEEKRKKKFPVTLDEMRNLIRQERAK